MRNNCFFFFFFSETVKKVGICNKQCSIYSQCLKSSIVCYSRNMIEPLLSHTLDLSHVYDSVDACTVHSPAHLHIYWCSFDDCVGLNSIYGASLWGLPSGTIHLRVCLQYRSDVVTTDSAICTSLCISTASPPIFLSYGSIRARNALCFVAIMWFPSILLGRFY